MSWENADSSIGTSWGIVSASNSGQKVAVFRGDFYGSIYRSTDYGSTFQEITYPAGQNSNSCLGMSYSPNGATLVILCSSHLAPFYSLYSSSNDGATWGALSWNAPNLAWGVMNIELLNDSLSHIAASSRIGEGCANPDVVVSTNSGNTWSTPYSGDGPYACSQGVTLWRVAGANTVVSECFESSNFGTSWSTSTQYANGGGCARAANAGGDMIFWDGKMRYAGSQAVVDRNSALTGSIADAAISVNGNYAYVLTSNGLFRGTR